MIIVYDNHEIELVVPVSDKDRAHDRLILSYYSNHQLAQEYARAINVLMPGQTRKVRLDIGLLDEVVNEEMCMECGGRNVVSLYGSLYCSDCNKTVG